METSMEKHVHSSCTFSSLTAIKWEPVELFQKPNVVSWSFCSHPWITVNWMASILTLSSGLRTGASKGLGNWGEWDKKCAFQTRQAAICGFGNITTTVLAAYLVNSSFFLHLLLLQRKHLKMPPSVATWAPDIWAYSLHGQASSQEPGRDIQSLRHFSLHHTNSGSILHMFPRSAPGVTPEQKTRSKPWLCQVWS